MRFVPRKSVAQQAPPVPADCAECRTGSLNEHLNQLTEPISRGSRDAFVTLFDHTRAAVHASIDLRLQDPESAAAAFAATYVEIWWLAGCHTGPDTDVIGWIDHIVERRTAEAHPHPSPPTPLQEPTPVNAADPQQLRATLELSSLLGRPVDPPTHIDLGRC
jgi:hypothetical protein